LGFDSNFERAGSVAGIDYDVYAKDAYGCIVCTSNCFADEEPTITAPDPICYDGTEFTIYYRTVDPAVGALHTV
jgi:hypothetical protein